MLIFATAALGAVTISVQVVFLRELLGVLYGNELIIGLLLALWMGLTGIGAYLGGKRDRKEEERGLMAASFLLLAWLPIASVSALRLLRHLIIAPGVMIPVGQAFMGAAILLTPFCLVSGITFPLLVRALARQDQDQAISQAYSLESLGSLLGGAAVSIVFIFCCSTFTALYSVFFLAMIVSLLFALRTHHPLLAVGIALLGLAGGSLFFFLNLDTFTRAYLFPHQRILYHCDTPYGNVTVTNREGELYCYENGLLIASPADVITREETVHYAMIQHPHPEKVLVISGGLSGITREIFKYGNVSIHYVELDPALITIAQHFTPYLKDPRIRIITADARRYIKTTSATYDMVIMDLPDPVNAQINRCYTDEFFRSLKAIMNRGGVYSFSLTSSADYLGEESRLLKGNILHTLRRHFSQVIMIPGAKDYFIAADDPLSWEITRRIEAHGIPTTYVNRYYLDDHLLAARGTSLMQQLSSVKGINKDFSPIAYYYHLRLWLHHDRGYAYLYCPIIFTLLLLALALRRLTTVTLGMFIGGFSSSTLEIILMLGFQIIYGYIYHMLALIISAFMAGLACGATWGRRTARNPIMSFIGIQFGVALSALLIPMLYLFLASHPINPIGIQGMFLGVAFIIALFIGREFTLAASLTEGTVTARAARIYGVDLLGAALGALLVASLLIPLWGIFRVTLFTACLNMLSAGIAFYYRKNYMSRHIKGT